MDEKQQRSFEQKFNVVIILLLVSIVLIGFRWWQGGGLGSLVDVELGSASADGRVKLNKVMSQCADYSRNKVYDLLGTDNEWNEGLYEAFYKSYMLSMH